MYGLKVLQEKALIKIVKGKIWIHDLIEDMGKEIVRQESPDVIGKRSRLWLYENVREVLEENSGTDNIKAIVLRRVSSSQKIRLNGGSFTNLKNLRIFKVNDVTFSNDGMFCGECVDYLPNQLRVLDWKKCSLRLLPTSFNPTKLGMLRMGGPCATPLVNERLKNVRYLKSIQLSNCDGLTRSPNLSGLTSLEHLELSYCRDLVEVHPSVGCLDKLVYLVIRDCKKLEMFQERINMKSLETLVLSCCPLKFFPEIEGDMKALYRLDLTRTAIKELACSVGNLTGLKSLSLADCCNLTNVPSSIFYGLQRLEDLDLRWCDNLVTFPTKSESLPSAVFSTNLTSRLQVHLDYCKRLEEISEFPREIHGLSVDGSGSLERISKLSGILEGKDSKMFGELDLTGCRRLCDNLARGVVSEVKVDNRLFLLAKNMKKMISSLFAGTKELVGEADKLTALLTHFFSCSKSSEEFQVTFPARAPLPNWFTCRQDVEGEETKGHECRIEIPQNAIRDNKGLALCIQSCDYITYFVYINGVQFSEKTMFMDAVWVHYIPFVTVIRRLSECGMPPPDMFRVMFRFENEEGPFWGSWGVHLIEDFEGEGR